MRWVEVKTRHRARYHLGPRPEGLLSLGVTVARSHVLTICAVLAGNLAASAAAVPTRAPAPYMRAPVAMTTTAGTTCPKPQPLAKGLALMPSSGELPLGASATFVASGGVLPLKVGKTEVTFQVVCGPDASESRPAPAQVRLHQTSYTPGVPSAYFTLTNRGAPGTDLISATTTNALGQEVRATASVQWVKPVPCGQPLPKLGYLRALQCKLAAARTLVATVLQTGSCALGVATFFVPVGKIAKLLDEAGAVATAGELARGAALSTPVAKLVFDLRQLADEGVPGISLLDIKNTFEDAKSAPAFLQAVVSLVSKLANFSKANISDIALDVADLTGLEPCVELLAKIVGTTAPRPTVPGPSPTGAHVLGWGLMGPEAMAVYGRDLFVANSFSYGFGSVTELDASTGALVRVILGPAYGFDYPDAMVVAGGHLFVTNSPPSGSGSVTELDASTGALVRVISGPAYRFDLSHVMAVYGGDVFVANSPPSGSVSVTELDASTGALVRVISGPVYRFNSPDDMAVYGGDLFVANSSSNGSGSVTELDASTGALVRVISGSVYRFSGPGAMAVYGSDLFVANGSGSVTELDGSTGALVRVISGPAYRFNSPGAMAVYGGDLFVVNGPLSGSGWVTELDTSTGALVRVISGPAYRFSGSGAMAVAGGHLFVANAFDDSVTELAA